MARKGTVPRVFTLSWGTRNFVLEDQVLSSYLQVPAKESEEKAGVPRTGLRLEHHQVEMYT